MRTIKLKLTPLDVLFFRDARPFGAADHGESGLPTPQSFAGMLKTHLMSHAGLTREKPGELHRLCDRSTPRETWPWFAQLRFRGPWLAVDQPRELQAHWNRQEEFSPPDHPPETGPLVAVPADMMQIGKPSDGVAQLKRLRPIPREIHVPGWQPRVGEMRPLWSRSDDDLRAAEGLFFDLKSLAKYLSGEPRDESQTLRAVSLRHLVAWEGRTGIGINPQSLTSEEGQIYSTRFLRLRPGVGFVGEVDVPESAGPTERLFPQSLVLPWGGEGRRVLVERCDATTGISGWTWPTVAATDIKTELLTVLITPGIFHSRDLRARPLWKPCECGELVAAAVPKPLAVSGWDMAGNAAERAERGLDATAIGRPRPTRFAVPAGSVYLWRRSSKRAAEPPTLWPELCDKPQDHDLGWGVALSGVWRDGDFKPCPQ